MKSYPFLSGVVLFAACAIEPISEAPSTEVMTAAIIPPEDVSAEPEQGKFILGRTADGYLNEGKGRHFHVSPTAVDLGHAKIRVRVATSNQGAYLIAEKSGVTLYSADANDFDGMILQGVDGGQLLIESAVRPPGSAHTLYFLRYRPGTTGDFTDYYCGRNLNGPPIGAVPLRGYYTRSRYHENADTITFGCDGSVVKKCIWWGYLPGDTGPSPNPNVPNDWDYHQACTRMANADYCATGESSTRELTPILIRDFKPGGQLHPNGEGVVDELEHATIPGDLDQYYIEAAWRAGRRKPLCASSARWAAMPLRPCGVPGAGEDHLIDPRLDPSARLCDEFTYQELIDEGALIINASKTMDAPLLRWRKPSAPNSPADTLTTIRGFYIPSSPITIAQYLYPNGELPTPDERSIIPFASLGYTQFQGPEGLILRNLPGTLNEADMIKLYVWEQKPASSISGDRTVASEAAAAAQGFTSKLDFEGYAFKISGQVNAPLQPLGLCKPGGNHDIDLSPTVGCSWSGFGMPTPPAPPP